MPQKIQKKITESPIALNESQQIQTILGHPPKWLLKWGISAVGLVVSLILMLSWWIKYPDVMVAEVVMTTQNPAIRVIANQSGRLSDWLVTSDQMVVEKNQRLGAFHSTANHEDMVKLDAFLEAVMNALTVGELPKQLPQHLEIGELQSAFASLSERYRDLLYFKNATNTATQVLSIHQQIRHIERLIHTQKKQGEIFKKETALALKDMERYQTLYKEAGCSQVELEAKELNYLQHQRQNESLQSVITNYELEIEQQHYRISELKQSETDELATKINAVLALAHQLKGDVAAWKEKYWIVAPIAGRVSLSKIWASQQYVAANTEILTIIPTDTINPIVGRAVMPMDGAGKVKKGMLALISFANYPSQEFGTLSAKVGNIALIPQQEETDKTKGGYLLRLEVPQNMVTNYGRAIPFHQEMHGTAKIITENRRVLERITAKLVEMLNGNGAVSE